MNTTNTLPLPQTNLTCYCSTSISNTKKVHVTCAVVDAMPRSTDEIIKVRGKYRHLYNLPGNPLYSDGKRERVPGMGRLVDMMSVQHLLKYVHYIATFPQIRQCTAASRISTVLANPNTPDPSLSIIPATHVATISDRVEIGVEVGCTPAGLAEVACFMGQEATPAFQLGNVVEKY